MDYPLPDSFAVALAEYALGLIGSDELPHVAVCALRAGIESPMLAALAGEGGRSAPADLRELFDQGLSEAAIVLPDQRRAASTVLEHVVSDVASETVRPEDAVLRLHQLFIVLTGEGADVSHEDRLSTKLMHVRHCVWRHYYGEDDDSSGEATRALRKACEVAVSECVAPAYPSGDPYR